MLQFCRNLLRLLRIFKTGEDQLPGWLHTKKDKLRGRCTVYLYIPAYSFFAGTATGMFI